MSKIIAYIRISTDKQEINNQRLEIYEYAHKNNIKTEDMEFVELTISSTKSEKERKIDYLLEKLQTDDTLLITELSRLGRSTSGIINMVNQFLHKGVRIIAIKNNLDLRNKQDMTTKIIVTMFSLFSELERDLISLRTRESLAVKKSMGIKLGKPKGIIQKSKFDCDIDKIKEFLKLGLSARKIAKFFGYPNPIGLNNYIKRKKLRTAAV
jgi:DNA invertase Pin-like site-specific DNA recombinase